jgi:prepilin signal peptidase PulO-like enzyme (type II secretory pathway)
MPLIGGLLYFMSLHDLKTMQVPSLYFYLVMLCASITHLSNLTWWHVGLIACWLLFQLLPDTNRYFGAGDVDLCLSFAILFNLYHLAWLLLIASCTALLVAIVSGRRRLPFIPFLTAGYLTLLLVDFVRF